MKLIPLDAVLAKIDKKIKVLQKHPMEDYKTICHLDSLKQSINTLEVKEVDLEKEKDDYWNKLCDSEFGELLERDAKWFDDIAKHFFELGIAVSNKVQKGE